MLSACRAASGWADGGLDGVFDNGSCRAAGGEEEVKILHPIDPHQVLFEVLPANAEYRQLHHFQGRFWLDPRWLVGLRTPEVLHLTPRTRRHARPVSMG